MNLNDKVLLKSFLGKKKFKNVDDIDNFWLLIGEKGEIIEVNNEFFEGRVLVLFDEDLDKTVSFHSEALSKYEQELLTWSLHESNKDINKGKLKTSVIPIKTLKGKLKRYDFVDVEKA